MVPAATVRPSLESAVRRPGLWLLVLTFVLITIFQYAEELNHPDFLAHLNDNLGLTRFTVERILYLIPIIWAAHLFGWRGGAVTSLLAVGFMLPRGIFISPHPEDAIVETAAVFLVGNLAGYTLESLRRERERRAELEAVHLELQNHLRVIEENERRLAALNQTATIISQSLQLTDVLNSAVTCLMEVMGVEVIRIYIRDEVAEELILAAHRGVSEDFVQTVGRLKIGEGFNGRVAESGEPLFVEDASEDPRLTKTVVRDENIRSQLIVPMRAKGNVVGTISVAMHRQRRFDPAEVDLLTAIASQIGVAVDNARLYEQEREMVGQLKASEKRYRSLFEGAHDAIWLQDLGDNIIAANSSCVRLTGYSLDELCSLKSSALISEDTRLTARDIEQHITAGGASGYEDEVKLIRKDGTEVFVKLASSIEMTDGYPVAIQSIAHDVTEERRAQENLRYFVKEITRAQEEERKRIAQELHDDTVHALAVHAQQIDILASMSNRLSKREIPVRLEELREETSLIMQGIQRLSQDLRPATLDRLGLLPAVEWLVARTAEYSGLDIKVRFVGEEHRLPDEVELVLFRIVQEALRNAWRHSGADKADVTVEFGDRSTRITVRDNGKGFDAPGSVGDLPRYGKLGLAGMKERTELVGGTLEIISAPGKGTSVIVELPT